MMVVDTIFRGICKKQEEKKYCSLGQVILADIYLSLSWCKNGFPFFQGCNILPKWWMIEHLCKRDGTQSQEVDKPSQTSPLDNYELYLSIRRFPIHTTRGAWARVFYDLREGDMHWMLPNFESERIEAKGGQTSIFSPSWHKRIAALQTS